MSRRAPAPVDARERNLALSPANSCIVQAPAGSGKTTLLVSRFLRLLALADRPEQVLAITFTRKAAAEMRLRVTALLGDERSPEGARARARDAERGWRLAHNPSRLNIRTIDSFAMSLTRQMPISSGFDRTARLVENADELYSLAARRLFRRLYADDPLAEEIARFIALIDNDAHRARRLLANMLARRDHWLDEVTEVVAAYRRAPQILAELHNGALQTLIAAVSQDLETQIPQHTLAELEWAVAFSRQLDRRSNPGAFWRAAGRLLTTGKGRFRRQFTARDGFPPGRREEKRRALALIEAVGALGLETRLAALHRLPPEPLTPEQVEDLVAVCISLSLAVLDLSAVMRSQGVADFTELILGARRALRAGGNPTELALSIDNRIRHVLVDEFQDTSVVQFQLLELLVQGWSGESGVSLFAVGDPMQSIYRFRDADVGLFYRAESRGLDQLRLRPLRLAMNFRSAPRLVDWFNATFPEVMGEETDPLLGRVPYNACQAGAGHDGAAQVRLFETEADERQALIERISRLLDEEPDARIALLVRSRAHLSGILDALRASGIRWQATDIDALADTPAVTDLLSLAAALADPTDRLAWLGLMRAPWVGLGLADLEILGDIRTWNIASLREASPKLTPTGKRLLGRFMAALETWQPALHESPPRSVLESIWIQCGGPAAYGDEAAIDHAERFLELVDDLGSGGLDADRLRRGADSLFAVESAAANLQILTVHKAKGLEFDHVLLPFLDRQTKATEAPLLRWRLQDNRLLMAVRETGPLYEWLAEEDRQRERHELQRLLYVGCTRARRSLLLTAVHPGDRPASGSLLNLLWPRAAALPAETAETAEVSSPVEAAPAAKTTLPIGAALPVPAVPDARQSPGRRPEAGPLFQRLSSDFQWQPPARKPLGLVRIGRVSDTVQRERPEPDPIAGRREVELGNLVHAALCELGESGLPPRAADWIESRAAAWTLRLSEAGLSEPDIGHCRSEAARQIANVLTDETGRWILAGGTDAVSEFGVTGVVDGVIRSFRFDRAFADGGERWVIDYKSGPVAAGAQALEQAVARYRPQLDRYRTLAEELHEGPVHTGLYFTSLPRLVEV